MPGAVLDHGIKAAPNRYIEFINEETSAAPTEAYGNAKEKVNGIDSIEIEGVEPLKYSGG